MLGTELSIINYRLIGLNTLMDDSSVGFDQIEEENIFTDRITDEALEAPPPPIVLFACQFC